MSELSAKEHGRVGQWHLEQAVLQVLRRREGDWYRDREISDAVGLYWMSGPRAWNYDRRIPCQVIHGVLNKLCDEGRVEYRRTELYRLCQ